MLERCLSNSYPVRQMVLAVLTFSLLTGLRRVESAEKKITLSPPDFNAGMVTEKTTGLPPDLGDGLALGEKAKQSSRLGREAGWE